MRERVGANSSVLNPKQVDHEFDDFDDFLDELDEDDE